MSKRQRRTKVLTEEEETELENSLWTVEDKENLLKALHKYGHTDIQEISKMLPKKSDNAIKLMIHKFMQKGKESSESQQTALDSWLKSGLFDDKSIPVPQALKFISLFENHPPPQECGGFDFAAAYYYLYRTSLGYPPLELPPGNLKVINNLMEEVMKQVWPASEKEIMDYLANLERMNRSKKCYPPQKKTNF